MFESCKKQIKTCDVRYDWMIEARAIITKQTRKGQDTDVKKACKRIQRQYEKCGTG